MASDFQRAEGARAMRALLLTAQGCIRQVQEIARSIDYADNGREETEARLSDCVAALRDVADDAETVVWYATEGR